MNCTSLSYLRFIKARCDNNFSIANASEGTLPSNDSSEHQRLFALMGHYDFWDKTGKQLGFDELTESLSALKDTALQSELNEAISILIERLDVSEFDMPLVGNNKVDSSPINMHVRYPKEHILVAFGDSTFIKKSSSREGVLNIVDANTELLFVTLNKCEKTVFSNHYVP